MTYVRVHGMLGQLLAVQECWKSPTDRTVVRSVLVDFGPTLGQRWAPAKAMKRVGRTPIRRG